MLNGFNPGWQELGSQTPKYTLYLTADGSPTLELGDPIESPESMHNRQGAFSESLYVYLEAIRVCHNSHWPLRFLSLGLGLGYNELILAGYLAKEKALPQQVELLSFENVPWLRQNFLAWLESSGPTEAAGFSDLWQAYEKVLELVATHFEMDKTKIKDYLFGLHRGGKWILAEELNDQTLFSVRYNCILYDAYSSHTSPELWAEDFLIRFCEKAADSECILASYAATGSLKRALKQTGFSVDLKEGFGGKRHSTFAIKNLGNARKF